MQVREQKPSHTGLEHKAVSVFVFLFLVSPLFSCNLRTLPASQLFFFAHSISFQAHWLFQPTSPSLIGLLVMCLRQMEVDGPQEGCACACVTGIDFECVDEYVCGTKYVCKHQNVCVRVYLISVDLVVSMHATTVCGLKCVSFNWWVCKACVL